MFVSVADKLSITLYAKKFNRKLHDLFEDICNGTISGLYENDNETWKITNHK